jgi:hypothetical protein
LPVRSKGLNAMLGSPLGLTMAVRIGGGQPPPAAGSGSVSV